MEYCGPAGIARSDFLSWDRDDRDAALWWLIYKREACQSCGTRAEEWNPDLGGDLDAYIAAPTHCRGCEVRARGEEQFNRDRKQYRRGTSIALQRPPSEESDKWQQ
jgi:hypothetical protein